MWLVRARTVEQPNLTPVRPARESAPAHRRRFLLCRLCGNVLILGYARRRGLLTAQLTARILSNCVFRRGMLTLDSSRCTLQKAGIIREGVRFAYY